MANAAYLPPTAALAVRSTAILVAILAYSSGRQARPARPPACPSRAAYWLIVAGEIGAVDLHKAGRAAERLRLLEDLSCQGSLPSR